MGRTSQQDEEVLAISVALCHQGTGLHAEQRRPSSSPRLMDAGMDSDSMVSEGTPDH